MAVSVIEMKDVTVEVYTTAATPSLVADLTEQVDNLSLEFTASERVRTTFSRTWARRGAGIKDGSLTINFFSDADNNGVNDVLNTYFGEEITFYIEDGAAHEYRIPVIVNQWNPLNGAVDADAMQSITFPLADTPTLPTIS